MLYKLFFSTPDLLRRFLCECAAEIPSCRLLAEGVGISNDLARVYSLTETAGDNKLLGATIFPQSLRYTINALGVERLMNSLRGRPVSDGFDHVHILLDDRVLFECYDAATLVGYWIDATSTNIMKQICAQLGIVPAIE